MDEQRLAFPVAVQAEGADWPFALSQSVLDHAPIGMVLTTADGTIIWANAAMNEVLDVVHTDLVNRDFNSFIHPDDQGLVTEDTARLTAAPAGAAVATREIRWASRGGPHRWTLARSAIALDPAGDPIHHGQPPQRCIIRQLLDTTEQRNAEARSLALARELQALNDELRRSNEELTQYAYIASHDLSEPLRVIAGHVELLAARYHDTLDDTAREWIDYAVDGCARMRTLIDDLLRYSRAGRDLTMSPVDLGAIVEQARQQLTPSLDASGALLIVDTDLPVLLADASGLTQVMTNLINNAIKYARPGVPPAIHIRADHLNDHCRISIADNGIGIPAKHRDRVFGIFQRLHGRGVPGTGIGLAICRRIVDHHGGTITVTDTPAGGATFVLTLPQGSAAA